MNIEKILISPSIQTTKSIYPKNIEALEISFKENNDLDAAFSIAVTCQFRDKDDAKAMVWYINALKNGKMEASYYLGNLLFLQGNELQANEAFMQGHKMGFIPSTYCLGVNLWMRGRDIGDKKLKSDGMELMEIAANNGNYHAQLLLGSLYRSGSAGFLKIFTGIKFLTKYNIAVTDDLVYKGEQVETVYDVNNTGFYYAR